MKSQQQDNTLTLFLEGNITSANAHTFEAELMEALSQANNATIVLDASQLAYISSAGLRALLKLRKQVQGVPVIQDVSPEVYEVFQTTGFTEFFTVYKRMRQMSIEGLDLIGQGANGDVYRLNEEQIIKVYNPVTNTLEKIRREKEAARQAFIHGIPSAISYDIVQVGDRYGLVYEMVNASTLGELMAREPERVDEYSHRMAALLKQLHATKFEPGILPDARQGLHSWADVSERSGYYSAEVISKLRRVIDSIPPRDTFVHGDFHPGNIMVMDDEFVLIDMGDASVGDPLVDLLGSYQMMKLVAQRQGGSNRYVGVSQETLLHVWDVFIRDYTGISDDEGIAAYEQKLRFYGITRSMAGVTFSELIPKEAKPALVQDITRAFLAGCERLGIE